MKRCIKYVIAMSIMAIFVACTTQHEEIEIVPKTTANLKISKEQALTYLYGDLRLIDGEKTRSGQSPRTVKSIKQLKGARTRSGKTLPSDLLYIVEFEEGQGSAVLSADARITPVIAILDESVLTEEDFASSNTEEIGPFVASLITNHAEMSVQNNRAGFLPHPGGIIADTVFYYHRPAFLRTKWHQDSPYNQFCHYNNQIDTLAGCVPVAIAQFLFHTKWSEGTTSITVNNTPIDLSLVSYCQFGEGARAVHLREAAKLIHAVGVSLGINYSSGYVGVVMSDGVQSFMRSLGYSGAHYTEWEYNPVFSKVYGLGKPMIMRGKQSGADNGHAWVLDGWDEYQIGCPRFTIDGGVVYDYLTARKVHCNFGWGGLCDGYYTIGAFDTTVENPDIELGVGDYKGTATSNYNCRFYIVNY